jgi:hypothetical protein
MKGIGWPLDFHLPNKHENEAVANFSFTNKNSKVFFGFCMGTKDNRMTPRFLSS